MKTKTKSRKATKTKSRSINEKELAEIALDAYWISISGRSATSWDCQWSIEKTAWRSVVQAVMDEALFRMEASLNKK